MARLSNTELARRTLQLSKLPTDVLKRIYRGVYGQNAVCPNPKTMVKQLVKNDEIEWSDKDTNDVKEEIQNLNDWQLLKKIIRIATKCHSGLDANQNEYTSLGFKMFLDQVFKVPDDKVLLWREGGFTKSVGQFLTYLSSECPNGPDDAEARASEMLQAFKDKVIITCSKSLHATICHNFISDAGSALSHHGGNPPERIGGPNQVIHMLSHAMSLPEYHRFNDAYKNPAEQKKLGQEMLDYVAPDMLTEDTDVAKMVCVMEADIGGGGSGNNYAVQSVQMTGGASGPPQEDVVEEDPPDLISAISSVPDVEEAPPVETTTADVVTPENAHLSVKIVQNTSAEAKELRYPTANSHMTRHIAINKITSNSWRKFRKEHNLTGRCEVYVMSNPGVMPKQNKCFRYKVGHVCDEGWEGAEPDMMPTGNGEGDEVPTGSFSSIFPYGEVYIITNTLN